MSSRMTSSAGTGAPWWSAQRHRSSESHVISVPNDGTSSSAETARTAPANAASSARSNETAIPSALEKYSAYESE